MIPVGELPGGKWVRSPLLVIPVGELPGGKWVRSPLLPGGKWVMSPCDSCRRTSRR